MRTILLRTIRKSFYLAVEARESENKSVNRSKRESPFSPGRRKAIKAIGLGVTGLSMSSASLWANPIGPVPLPSDKNQVSIAILGGGIAGLHCAWTLKRMGIHATIYEATHRAGGRIYTLHDRFGPNLNTEAGGEFLDSNHEDMLQLATHFKLPLLDVTADQDHFEDSIFHFGDRLYGQKDLVEAFRPIVDLLMDHRGRCGENYDTAFARELDLRSLEEYLQSLPCETWLKEMLTAAYVGEYGLDAGEQSSLNFLCLIGFPKDGFLPIFGESDERYKVIGGNQQIIYKLAEDLKDQIEYGKPVTAIHQKGRGYSINFSEGKAIKADIIVCTIPFTVLRNIELKIGEIDPVKLSCINELGYGQNNKLLLGMGQRIWRMGARPTRGYTYDNDIHTGWDNTHMQGNNEGKAGFTVFLGGGQSLRLAAHTTKTNSHGKLDPDHLNQYISRLDNIYAGFSKNFLNDHEVITWTGNPFSQASYSCYKTGQWDSISGSEITPIRDSFLFAGEHCSSLYQGFMNGGAETGRRAAQEIAMMVGTSSGKPANLR